MVGGEILDQPAPLERKADFEPIFARIAPQP